MNPTLKRRLKILTLMIASFVAGIACVLVMAGISSGHWVSLNYVFKAYDLRLDGGEAAAANDWREVDRDFGAVLKIKGTKGGDWYWAWPLVAWIDLDYTVGPGLPYTREDLAIAAYAAAKSGDEERAAELYRRLEKISPGTPREKWDLLASRSLRHFAESADIVRRGKMPDHPELNPPSPPSASTASPHTHD